MQALNYFTGQPHKRQFTIVFVVLSLAICSVGLAKNERCEYREPIIEIYMNNSAYDRSYPMVKSFKFRRYDGEEKEIRLFFTYAGNRVIDGVSCELWRYDTSYANVNVTADLEEMQSEAYERRGYWDNLFLENDLTDWDMPICSIKFLTNYRCHEKDKPDSGVWNAGFMMLSRDQPIMVNLAAGNSLHLTPYRIQTVYGYHNITYESPEVMKMIAKDLGNYSSDSTDQHTSGGKNSKYSEKRFGIYMDRQCSEFVSWYYYNYTKRGGVGVGLKIDGNTPGDFKNLYLTDDMMDVFENAGQLYKWIPSANHFCKTNSWDDDDISSQCGYRPLKGDYLAYIKNANSSDRSEHSMMLWKDWDFQNPEIQSRADGPWPVKVRDKNVNQSGYDWYVGKTREFIRVNGRTITGNAIYQAADVWIADDQNVTLAAGATLTVRGDRITFHSGFRGNGGSSLRARAQRGILGYHIDH